MNSRVKNLTGEKYGRLTVIMLDETKKTRKKFWICQCDCGNLKAIRSDSLQSGGIKSCGCLKKEQDRINLVKNHSHKESNTRLYTELRGIKARCLNPNNDSYKRYGGRGIIICGEWLDSYESFRDWALNNGYNDILTIDRINNDGNYEPNNCRWVDNKTQCNNRSTNIIVKYQNEEITLKQLSEKTNIDYSVLNTRYHRGDRGECLIRSVWSGFKPKNGENNGMAQITEKDAKVIKDMLYNNINYLEISRRLNISKHIIYDIKRNRTWKHTA